jgi:hypothetical protein
MCIFSPCIAGQGYGREGSKRVLVEKGWFVPTLQFGPDDVFLFEDWDETPVGPYRALFHFTPDDHRTLYVSSEEGRGLVSTIHRFDEQIVTAVSSRRQHGRWSIEVDAAGKGALSIEVDYRETGMLKFVNPIARRTPDLIARNGLYCKLMPRLAAPLLGTDPDQKIAGETELGRRSRFRLERMFMVTGGRCSWGGDDLGPLTDCCFRHDMGAFRPVSKAVVSYLSLVVE